MSAHRSSSKRLLVVLALALNAIVIAAIWLLFARDSDRQVEASVADEEAPTAPRPVLAREVQRPAPPKPAAHEHVAADGIGFMPEHDGDPRPAGALHPHPISAQHQRIFAENRIAFALDDATDAKDVSVMKELLARYRREFPEDQWPTSIELLYYSFHVMAGLGTLFIAIMGVAALQLWRGRLPYSTPLLWVLMLAFPFPYIANTAGWMTAELGRQPWLVYGLMRTVNGVSPTVHSGTALFTLIGFCGLYLVLGLAFLFLIGREIAHGPSAHHEPRNLLIAGTIGTL